MSQRSKGQVYTLKIITHKQKANSQNPFWWFDSNTTVAFDIETTGFSKQSNFIYLIGFSYQIKDELFCTQLLAQNRTDEPAILQYFFDACKQFDSLLTFNGDQFDIPFVVARGQNHHLSTQAFEEMKRFDLYKALKKLKKILPLPSTKQKSFEEFLQSDRLDEMDGGQLIKVYSDYEKIPSIEREELLLLHNYEDVLGLTKLQQLFLYDKLVKDPCVNPVVSTYFDQSNEVLLTQEHSYSVPKEVSVRNLYGYFQIGLNKRKVLLRFKKDIYRIPLLPLQDYVYLISEDTVIPKALASTVDPSNLKKANSRNCFLERETECIELPITLLSQLEQYHIPVWYPVHKSTKSKTIAITKDSYIQNSTVLSSTIMNELFNLLL